MALPGYNLEQKITYDLLSPSLQKMLNRKLPTSEVSKVVYPYVDAGDSVVYNYMDDSAAAFLDKLQKEHANENTQIDNAYNQWQTDVNKLRDDANKIVLTDDPRLVTMMKAESGMDGMIVKMKPDQNSMFMDDNFRSLRVVSTDAELAEAFSIFMPISLKNVFNSWYRYVHYNWPNTRIFDKSNQNSSKTGWHQNEWDWSDQECYLNRNKNGWVYSPWDRSIFSLYDNVSCAGFINPSDYYTNYLVRLRVDVGWDDDNLMIIIGFIPADESSDGHEHTLSLVRGAGYYNGGDDTIFYWGLVYDMGNPTQYVLRNLSNYTGSDAPNTVVADRIVPRSSFCSDWTGQRWANIGYHAAGDPNTAYFNSGSNCICYITVIRNNQYFVFKTTDWSKDGSDKTDVDAWTFEWHVEKNYNPFGSSYNDMWQNLVKMTYYQNRIGFGVRSGMPEFRIDKQYELFEDGDIYALHTDTVYTYNEVSEQWEVKGTVRDAIPNRIFLYNPKMQKFYFYTKPYQYTRITR